MISTDNPSSGHAATGPGRHRHHVCGHSWGTRRGHCRLVGEGRGAMPGTKNHAHGFPGYGGLMPTIRPRGTRNWGWGLGLVFETSLCLCSRRREDEGPTPSSQGDSPASGQERAPPAQASRRVRPGPGSPRPQTFGAFLDKQRWPPLAVPENCPVWFQSRGKRGGS